MEEKIKKCSLKKHTEVDAISYCQECKIYLCNKCLNHHKELFDKHNINNLNNDLNEIFIDACKQHNFKLEFYCESHNIL